MRILYYCLSTFAIVFFMSMGTVFPAAFSDKNTAVPGELVVDFTNDESRSISIRLGSGDGITADMNFAVLDSTGVQITEFYPHEILNDRFWSGPLADDDFSRIRLGATVVRVNLGSDQAALLREQFTSRLDALKIKRQKRKISDLELERMELEELINDIDVESVGLINDLKTLRGKLKREKDFVRRHVDDLQDRITSLKDDRSEMVKEREDLLDRREGLLRRSDPPQDRISDLNQDISGLDRDIGKANIEISDLRDEVRDQREVSRSIQEEISSVQEKLSELEGERRELERDLKAVERKIQSAREGTSH